MVEDIFHCHNCGKCSTAFSGQRPGMLLNILQYTEQAPMTRGLFGPNSVEVDKFQLFRPKSCSLSLVLQCHNSLISSTIGYFHQDTMPYHFCIETSSYAFIKGFNHLQSNTLLIANRFLILSVFISCFPNKVMSNFRTVSLSPIF